MYCGFAMGENADSDPEWGKSGSGKNIPDPQHWIVSNLLKISGSVLKKDSLKM